MAISPITIATHGLLNSPLSVAAVRGRLRIDTGVVVKPPGGGGKKGGLAAVPGTWEHPYVIREKLLEQIKREDEEILAIIQAFMELQ